MRLAGNQLSVLLPTCESPARGDRAWHTMTLTLHDYAAREYGSGTLCRPALRITPDSTYLLVPIDVGVPEVRYLSSVGNKKDAGTGPGDTLDGADALDLLDAAIDRYLGLDWGQRMAWVGAVVTRDGAGALTTGRPYYFNAFEIQAKQYRRREEAEHLRDKADRIDEQLRRRYDPALAAKRDMYLLQADLLWRRIGQCHDRLDDAKAIWAVETAMAEDCGIAMEDLDSLEAGGRDSRTNGRVSMQPRGTTQGKIIDKAHLKGVPVTFIPAAHTSDHCSRCGRPSNHQQAPNVEGGNPSWLVCECGRSSNRDHSGAEAIGAAAFDYESLSNPKASHKPRPKRGSKRLPVAGPASRRKIKVKHDRRRSIQTSPIPQYEQRSHTPRSSKRIPSRRVDRGSVVASAITMPAERRTPTPPRSPRVSGLLSREPRSLDGLAGGYWRSVRFTRPRARAAPRPAIEVM